MNRRNFVQRGLLVRGTAIPAAQADAAEPRQKTNTSNLWIETQEKHCFGGP
jgi:hypothetical protein